MVQYCINLSGRESMAKKGFNKQSVDQATADRLGDELLAEVAKGKPDLDKMKDLIAQGANLEKQGSNGYPPLLLAAMSEKNDAAFLLLDSGANPDGAAPTGASPLVFAALSGSSGNLPLVKKLLDKNADPNKYAHQTKTAVMWAAHRGFTDIALEIGSRGGDLLQKSTGSDPMNAMEWALDNNKRVTAEQLQRLQERKEQEAAAEKAKEEERKAEAEAATAKQAFENALQYNISTHKPLTAPKRASFTKKPETLGQK